MSRKVKYKLRLTVISCESLGHILFGIPARSMLVNLPETNPSEQVFIHGFLPFFYELINIFLFCLCITLTVRVTSNLNMFSMTVPIFSLIYSFIICVGNRHSTLSMSLMYFYEKWFGSLLGGTQWLIFILRRFGAKIDNDVIIDEMNCIEDIHLTTIGSHTRLSATSRIQVDLKPHHIFNFIYIFL